MTGLPDFLDQLVSRHVERRGRHDHVPCAGSAQLDPDDKIHLAHDYLLSDLPRLRARLDAPVDGMVLVSRRHLRSKNTWLHNVRVLVKGKDRCTLLMHPEDGARLAISDGSTARISSEAGSILAPVELSDEMLPGVVCLPHGWGHDKEGTRLSVAREHAGVNNNLLAPGEFVDTPTGKCIDKAAKAVVFPKSKKKKFGFSYPLTLQ